MVGAAGLALGLLVPVTRRWWPLTAAVSSYLGARWEPIAPVFPKHAPLLVPALVVAALVGGLTWAEAETARRASRPAWFVPALITMTAGGVYGAVPDTEAPLWVAGTMAILLLASAAPIAVPTTLAWAAPAVLVVWAAAVGAIGRPASFFGIVACFGVVAAEPIARGLLDARAGGAGPAPLTSWPLLLALHLAAVAIGSRALGLTTSGATAVVGATLTLGALTGLVLAATLVADRRAH